MDPTNPPPSAPPPPPNPPPSAVPVAGAAAVPAPAKPAAAPAAPPKAPAAAKIVTVAALGDEDESTEVLDSPAEIADLRKLDIFADIPESVLQMYPGTVARRKYKPGDVICTEGEGGTTAFYIAEGEVLVSIRSAEHAGRAKRRGGLLAAVGRILGQRTLSSFAPHAADTLVPIDASVDLRFGRLAATLGKGEMFGEMSCLSRAPRSATIIAKTDCVLLEILRNMYERLQNGKTFKARAEQNYRNRALAGHLHNVGIFESLPDEGIERLKNSCELLTVEPGKAIITEGEDADSMYIIRLGQVRVSKKLAGGELTLAYLGKGDCFGEIGLLGNTKRGTTCTAYSHPTTVMGTDRGTYKAKPSRVELVKIKKSEFDWVTKEYPFVKEKLEAMASGRAAATESAVKQGAFSKAPKQVEDLGLLQGQGLLLIDLERCTRCDQCVQACVESHDDGVTRLVREGPRYDKYLVPSRCRMCMDPVCMIGCPVGSIRRTKDLNMLIEEWCIGCGVCANQCPYNSIQMHDRSEFEAAAKPAAGGAAGAPAAPDRKEKAVVCDQCSSLPQGPACVYSCPHDAAFRVNARDFFLDAVANAE